MKLSIIVLVLTAIVISECGHTFLGTNVMRQLAYHGEAKYSSNLLRKRIEYFNFTMPYGRSQSIQGILAYDLTNTSASANVTSGGLGYNHVTLRMKSERGKSLKYDIYIYV